MCNSRYDWKALGIIFQTPPSFHDSKFVQVSYAFRKLGFWSKESLLLIQGWQFSIFLNYINSFSRLIVVEKDFVQLRKIRIQVKAWTKEKRQEIAKKLLSFCVVLIGVDPSKDT